MHEMSVLSDLLDLFITFIFLLSFFINFKQLLLPSTSPRLRSEIPCALRQKDGVCWRIPSPRHAGKLATTQKKIGDEMSSQFWQLGNLASGSWCSSKDRMDWQNNRKAKRGDDVLIMLRAGAPWHQACEYMKVLSASSCSSSSSWYIGVEISEEHSEASLSVTWTDVGRSRWKERLKFCLLLGPPWGPRPKNHPVNPRERCGLGSEGEEVGLVWEWWIFEILTCAEYWREDSGPGSGTASRSVSCSPT